MTEWPKSWDEITGVPDYDNDDTIHFRPTHQWMEYQDGIRGYDGTLYASVDVGRETDENRDLWLPFDEYIDRNL